MALKRRKFRYTPLSADEQELGMMATAAVTTDPEILEAIDEYHSAGLRCGVVAEFSGKGKLHAFGGMEAEDLKAKFPFGPVAEALDQYEPGESLCFILIRNRRVSASIAGSSEMQKKSR